MNSRWSGIMATGVLVATLVTGGVQSQGALDFTWGDTVDYLNNEFLFADTLANPIMGSFTDPAAGGFIQLIWTGANGVLDPLNPLNPGGVANDDLVVANAWMGKGKDDVGGAFPVDGVFESVDDISTAPSYVAAAGHVFYIRFFDTPSPSFGTGAIPTDGTFGELGTHTLSQAQIDQGSATFAFNPAPSTPENPDGLRFTTAPVPEPSTMALLVMGGLTALGLKRRQKA